MNTYTRKSLIALAVAAATSLSYSVSAQQGDSTNADTDTGQIEKIMVTANRQSQDIQDVSSSVSALGPESIEKQGIVDISGLENIVPGLRIGVSGGEVRPAMRGARTNEVGVAGTGIAEQVVGIFQDGVYVPTTTAGLGAYADLERIEVLRGPQGTLYGRNTFAGSINVISKQPVQGETSGSIELTHGSYNRSAYEGVLNLPLSENIATRTVISSDRHDGMIKNHFVQGPSDDLREKNQFYLRNITAYEGMDDFKFTLRTEYSNKDSNSEAIWGYQQIAGYQITETSPGSGVFNPDAIVTQGHIYQPDNSQRDDLGPYDVFRNAVSRDEQETFSVTAIAEWMLDSMNVKWTSNYSELSGQQFYDNDYSDGGIDFVGGFGRQDDQEAMSTELQLSSAPNDGPLSWIAGAYIFSQEADWEWLWREDTTGDGVADTIAVPGWGNPDYDPHTVDSLAVFGQLRYQLAEATRVVAGLRYNEDEKSFTGDGAIPDWSDDAVLYKFALEQDITDDIMTYASVSTGIRTGGANDARVVARGAEPLYDNEEVISYELGLKSFLADNTVRLNLSAFANEYSDVKAQLFAVACNDTTAGLTVTQCVAEGSSTTFEYYQNGGEVTTYGLEADLQWRVSPAFTVNSTLALIESEFDDNYEIGSELIQPLLGLGNIQGRQDINDNSTGFNFGGWSPAMSPSYTFNLNATYEIETEDGYILPYVSLNFVDDYYAFDVNIPETLVEAHVMASARVRWQINDSMSLTFFGDNLTDEAVITRAVVHSQIVNGLPANSVQTNWNNPRTFGVTYQHTFF